MHPEGIITTTTGDSEEFSLSSEFEKSENDSNGEDALEMAIEGMYKLIENGQVSIDELSILMEYIDAKLKDGMVRNKLAS